jgi:hypothetical protein
MPPEPHWRVVSTVRDAKGVRLRVVGPRPTADAVPVPPTLEEGYLSLMSGPLQEDSSARVPQPV